MIAVALFFTFLEIFSFLSLHLQFVLDFPCFDFGLCLGYSANKKRSSRTENRWKIIGQNNEERFSLTLDCAISIYSKVSFYVNIFSFSCTSTYAWPMDWPKSAHLYSLNRKSERKIGTNNNHTIITIFFNPKRTQTLPLLSDPFAMRHTHKHARIHKQQI